MFNKDIKELDGDLMPVSEFLEACEDGFFIDYDGYGYPVKDNKYHKLQIYPSCAFLIPSEATHIMWFNR